MPSPKRAASHGDASTAVPAPNREAGADSGADPAVPTLWGLSDDEWQRRVRRISQFMQLVLAGMLIVIGLLFPPLLPVVLLPGIMLLRHLESPDRSWPDRLLQQLAPSPRPEVPLPPNEMSPQ